MNSEEQPASWLDRVHAGAGLSHSQIQIWIGQKLNHDSPLYNMAFAFVLDGEVDTNAFQAAWQRVVDASDALRTTVEESGGIGVRRVRDPGCCATRVLDFSSSGDAAERAFREWAIERCARPLPLDGELVDSVLVKLGGGRHGWYLNQHHLITDASSTILLFRRVAGEYAGTTADPVSYYAVVDSLKTSPTDKNQQTATEHWKTHLEKSHRANPFYDRNVVTPASTRSQRLTLALDEPTSRRLRERGGEPGFLSFTSDISMFSVFATLLTGWLHRLSGVREPGFDAPAHCRPTPAARGSLGLFIEMFPFAVEVTPDDSFRTLGGKCLAETQQFLRFAIPGSSSPAGAAAGNAVLNFFTGAFGSFAGIPVAAEWIHSGHSDSVHAVRLQVHDYGDTGRYTLHFDFNEEAFPSRLRTRAVGHFEKILAAFLEDPDRAVAGVEILGDDERTSLLVDFNDTDGGPLPDRSVVALFDEQVERTPDRTALRQGEREMTFSELRRGADGVAAELLRRGVTPGTPVAVFMRRSVEAVVAILGILKARGAYVPIDPGYPEARVGHILDDSGAKLVLVQKGIEPVVAGADLLRVEEPFPAGDSAPPLVPPGLDELAYIIYTSGSTGLPKGVLIEHGGLADYLLWAERQYVRGECLTFALFTSLAFDLTVTSLYLPLITGGVLSIYEEPEGPLDTALMDVVGNNAVDFIKLTPSHLSLLGQLDLSSSRIRRMVVGGEDFKTRLAAAVSAQFEGRVEIYNEYGPTEAVVGCMIHRYDPAADTETSVPIGRPADHVRLYVLNDRLTPVPEGVPGELCVSRFGLARGYHDREELTACQFVPSPFRDGELLYRTGDLVRFIDPGTLEYLGRIDRQLKVSGYRVEPGEIETALLGHEAVSGCVVTALRGKPAPADLAFCERCGLPSNYPNVVFDEAGVCNVCRSYEAIREHAAAYFKTRADLEAVFRESAAGRRGDYDCMMLFSGGKDSTYALCQLVEMGLKVYAFSLDNGYISDQAKANIRRVVESLGIDHEFATTPAMNAIFRDSLARFSNVCNGCFKTIYTLSMNRARVLGIPLIVTGLSRGQFFETRLTENIFRDGRCTPGEVDAAVLAARKAYHGIEDEVSRSLDVGIFRDDRIFEEIRFVDFYRYCDASLEEMLAYLGKHAPWVRPSDTGRSTNCLVNDVGIYIHKKERGYHNYALPYSWDVRMGHKTRDEALVELNDDLDTENVRRMLSEIGYDEDRLTGGTGRTGLAAYYVASRDIPPMDLRRHLAASLPGPLIPQVFKRIDAIPLTPNGKVDLAALPAPVITAEFSGHAFVPPEGAVEERVAAIWSDVLGAGTVGAETSFFELGGTSLAAMEAILQLCNDFEIDLPLQTLFQFPTVRALAGVVERRIIEEVSQLSEEEAEGHLRI